ncbi:MAG: protein kinase [Acidobacteriota bacterium]
MTSLTCPSCGGALSGPGGRCLICGTGADAPTGFASPIHTHDAATLAGPLSRPREEDATIGGGPAPATPAPSAGRAKSGPLSSGQDFGARYHIIKTLGVGGMGAVYQAWDAELGVAVALKVIRPEALNDPQEALEIERRFKRELLLARQVTNKNVVRIHDLGEIDGIKYITMSYVEGEDLATTLQREGTLPAARVLTIARQVVSGMQAAHEAGVVHRDLKPANIMLDGEDQAFIMDFGIAQSSARPGGASATKGGPGAAPTSKPAAGASSAAALAADSAGSETMMGPASTGASPDARAAAVLHTRVGGVVGTLEYMAPEQSRGEPVDQRTDIYAFGLILSDLLTGRRAIPEGSSPWQELTTRVSQTPVSLRAKAPGLPEAIDTIVTRCVQLDPAERFQTTAELAAALGRLDADGNLIPEPVVRRFTPAVMAVTGAVVVALVGGTYWMARGPAPAPAAHKPVSVLIADFDNRTHEPVFDGLIEQALAVGVEGASFVTAYPRKDAIKLAGQITPGGHLDDATAVLVATREGVQRVVTGAIAANGASYDLTVRMVDPSVNKTLLTWDTKAANRDAVLGAVGQMAAKVRQGLGDSKANADKIVEQESFTAGSIDAARAYTSGQELQWAGKYEQAFVEYKKAVTLDPELGRAFAGLGAVTSSLGRRQEAEEFYKQALAHSSRMTEREKFRTRSGYYLLQRNSEKALEESKALVEKFPADTAGLANLAVAYFYRRDMTRAVVEGRRAVEIYPSNVIRRNNLALFEMYAGDFAAADREAGEVLKLNPTFVKAFVAKALSQLAAGRADDARATYAKLQTTSEAGRAAAATGLADLLMYQGKLTEAAGVLEPAMAAEKDASRQARLVVTLAEVRLLQARASDAVVLAKKAMAENQSGEITFLAGRVLAEGGQTGQALEIVTKLLQRFDAESLMWARVLEGDVALQKNDPRKAIERFNTARQFADSWLVRDGLGRAYLQAGAAAEADSEFDLCVKRRGEATAVLLDDVPSYRYYAPIEYYQGRVHEALGGAGAKDSYKAFLAIKEKGDEQGLVADARRRVGSPK